MWGDYMSNAFSLQHNSVECFLYLRPLEYFLALLASILILATLVRDHWTLCFLVLLGLQLYKFLTRTMIYGGGTKLSWLIYPSWLWIGGSDIFRVQEDIETPLIRQFLSFSAALNFFLAASLYAQFRGARWFGNPIDGSKSN